MCYACDRETIKWQDVDARITLTRRQANCHKQQQVRAQWPRKGTVEFRLICLLKKHDPLRPTSNLATGRPPCPTTPTILQSLNLSVLAHSQGLADVNPPNRQKNFRAAQTSCRELAPALPWRSVSFLTQLLFEQLFQLQPFLTCLSGFLTYPRKAFAIHALLGKKRQDLFSFNHTSACVNFVAETLRNNFAHP